MKNKPSFKDNTNTIEQELIKSLYTDKIESNKDWSYLLQLAIYLIKNYEEKHDLLDVEFAYYIFLKYAVKTKDYRPLFDFSTNFGFYPITKKLYELNLNNSFAASYAVGIIDEKYTTEEYVQTFEQKKAENKIEELDEERTDVSFIAPTSFGKSESIIKLIKRNNHKNFIIIEPTRALLSQMANNIHQCLPEKKVIVHDEMYNNDENFIAVLTQERAIRLITKFNDLNIGIVCIDEAHKILGKDNRSILLSVLIKILKEDYNPRLYYYSPVVYDSNSLKLYKRQQINEVRIKFNLKEPEIFEYRKDNTIYKYNRFFSEHYKIGDGTSYINYITSKSNNKNFIYLNSPKKVEMFANLLAEKLLPLEFQSGNLNNLIDILKKHVNEKFYLCNSLEKGILFLHAKLPDIIKDFLIYQYSHIPEIKYLIANSVILEGINLPIDTLFILNTHGLNESNLTNLIGRVNRFKFIFNNSDFNCEKLLPSIHFIDTNFWNSSTSNIENTVNKLGTCNNKDKIDNPLLSEFDPKNDDNKKLLQKKANDISTTLTKKNADNELEQLKKDFYKNGLNKFYKNTNDSFFKKLLDLIKEFKDEGNSETLLVLSKIFIQPFVYNITDFEFERLKNEEAVKYYELFYKIFTTKLLSEKITIMHKVLKSIKGLLYVGTSYGELKSDYYKQPVFINPKTKKDDELINIAITKIKMEEDFISLTLNNFINFMYEYSVISEETFNKYIYGTNDRKGVILCKCGIPSFVLAILIHENQINNIEIKDNGECIGNSEYQDFKNTQDDFVQYHLGRYIK